MKNYKILTDVEIDALADQVTIALNDGWDLAGHPFCTMTEICQPIIKNMISRPDPVRKKCDVDACQNQVRDGYDLCDEHYEMDGLL